MQDEDIGAIRCLFIREIHDNKYEVDDIVIMTGKIRSIEIFTEGGIDKDGKTILISEQLLLGRLNIDGKADN